MSIYFYRFGYERPDEQASNDEHGTDFESSGYFLIEAANEKAALDWGEKLANWFVSEAFERKLPYQWIDAGFASWIEKSVSLPINGEAPVIAVGEFPDLTKIKEFLLGPSN